MKCFKLSILLLTLTFLPIIAFAENPNDKLSIEYLELSKTKETLDMTIETYVQQFSAQNPNADKDKMRESFNAYMGWDVLKAPTIQIVSHTFTENELKDIISFYKSQSGKSYAEKSPQLSAEISKIIAENLQKAMSKSQQPKQQ
ncbi:MAG: DUF2059 domain-containing protein [Proteobacteria bacterium]|nr:DUF2059 domain-containing protein [Pseudomonadota bacterium]MBU1648536.1 DUF2059 domain-containing protein [Pseudomonadota bacterium]MBU1986704.1 DUF2059 domain-containing protein [Pseudomonadota bacterium]